MFLHVVTTFVFIQKILFPWSCPPPLSLTLFPSLLLQCFGRGGVVFISLLELCILQSHVFCAFSSCVSELITIYCKQKVLWCWLSSALIYGYSSKSLRVSLILCPLSRVTVIGSPLGPECLATGSINNSGCEFYLLEWALNPIRKWLVTSMTFMPLIAPVGMSCLASCYCSSRDPQRGKTEDCFSTLAMHSTFLHCER